MSMARISITRSARVSVTPTFSGCRLRVPPLMVASLKAAVSGPGDRHVVVVAHHPMVTGGSHGGHFTWRHHVFPLRAYKKWLWLPLPGIGSAPPVIPDSGMSPLRVKKSSGANVMSHIVPRSSTWKAHRCDPV